MSHTLLLLIACLLLTLLLDYLWLAKLMQRFYLAELGPYARRRGDKIEPVYWAAGLVYLLIPLGVVLFALPRVDPAAPLLSALSWGALFGLVLYGVYDLTNLATLERWPRRMVVVDIGWGTVLCAVTCAFASLFQSRLA